MIIQAFAAPGPFELILLLGIFGVVAAVIVVIVRSSGSRPTLPSAFPVGPAPDDRPGNFQIIGVNSHSRQDVRREFRADSMANARVKAELDGIVVTSITRIGD